MKRLFLTLVTVAVMLPAVAHESAREAQQTRDLRLSVRNKKGKTIRNLKAVAGLNSTGEARQFDSAGDISFEVDDRDTVFLMTPSNVYQFPVRGLKTLTVVFRNRSTVDGYSSPERDNNQLLNIGYGTIHRRNSLGAVTQLDVDDASGYADLQDYIEGKVPGVSFSAGKLYIRGGMTSLLGDTEALIVVDGVQVDNFAVANQMVNPQNVESISVLKDAASTAIYGVRGANGVVLITTKGANASPRHR